MGPPRKKRLLAQAHAHATHGVGASQQLRAPQPPGVVHTLSTASPSSPLALVGAGLPHHRQAGEAVGTTTAGEHANAADATTTTARVYGHAAAPASASAENVVGAGITTKAYLHYDNGAAAGASGMPPSMHQLPPRKRRQAIMTGVVGFANDATVEVRADAHAQDNENKNDNNNNNNNNVINDADDNNYGTSGSTHILWFGETRKGARGVTYYQGYTKVSGGANGMIRVGDFVNVMQEDDSGELTSSLGGMVEELYEKKAGTKFLKLRWFYHPRELKLTAKDLKYGKKEVFYTSHFQELSIDTVDGIATVLSPTDASIAAHAQDEHVYICGREYVAPKNKSRKPSFQPFNIRKLPHYDRQGFLATSRARATHIGNDELQHIAPPSPHAVTKRRRTMQPRILDAGAASAPTSNGIVAAAPAPANNDRVPPIATPHGVLAMDRKSDASDSHGLRPGDEALLHSPIDPAAAGAAGAVPASIGPAMVGRTARGGVEANSYKPAGQANVRGNDSDKTALDDDRPDYGRQTMSAIENELEEALEQDRSEARAGPADDPSPAAASHGGGVNHPAPRPAPRAGRGRQRLGHTKSPASASAAAAAAAAATGWPRAPGEAPESSPYRPAKPAGAGAKPTLTEHDVAERFFPVSPPRPDAAWCEINDDRWNTIF